MAPGLARPDRPTLFITMRVAGPCQPGRPNPTDRPCQPHAGPCRPGRPRPTDRPCQPSAALAPPGRAGPTDRPTLLPVCDDESRINFAPPSQNSLKIKFFIT